MAATLVKSDLTGEGISLRFAGMSEGKRTKILVVDDEPALRELMHQLLTEQGHVAVTAADGREALAVAERERPDLILLDIAMPVLDGLETCRQLRARPATRDIRIIMMTAYDSRDRLEDSIVAGADDFIGKPVNLTELQVRIGSMLKVKDMADEVARLEAYIKSLDQLRAQAAEPTAKL
jgi:putative two-component system response regulator